MDSPWWKRTSVYQIYPRSFADSNGDGIGDLQGIIGKLDYLYDLGVETLWLSPFFQSPQADFGYDISDHYSIAPEYGSLADCRELFRQVHARGMKLVLDMVLNHTSEQHPWFLESRSSRSSPKRDWYIWRNGRGSGPPNNWRSMLGGSGWHRDLQTGQWYFASFLSMQPDLNYRNPAVKQAMLDVVRHWLREGADGLRLDIFNALFKDPSFADNPFSWRAVPSENNPHGYFQHHKHTIDHPDTIAFARELRAVVDEYVDPPRFLVGEVFGDTRTLRNYCGEAADGLHLVFLFKALSARPHAKAIRALIEEFEQAFPEPFSPTYVFGNHDRPRLSHRLNNSELKAKLLAVLQLSVRGVPFIYYGEELGMENHDIPLHEGLDPVAARFHLVPQFLTRYLRHHGILLNRDECRSPMQWSAKPNAGFTAADAKPWLPLHPNYPRVNVEEQLARTDSLLSTYQAMLKLRRELPCLQAGALSWLEAPDQLVAFRRSLGGESADIYMNFSRQPLQIELSAKRMIYSNRANRRGLAEKIYILNPYEAIVLFDQPSTSPER